MRQAVLYARVSSKDQEREGFSIPAQLKFLREYARTHELNVLHEFVDVETAKTTGSEMVRFLRDHKLCRVVLVEKTDRPDRVLGLTDHRTRNTLSKDARNLFRA